jgi:DUF2911 family protein
MDPGAKRWVGVGVRRAPLTCVAPLSSASGVGLDAPGVFGTVEILLEERMTRRWIALAAAVIAASAVSSAQGGRAPSPQGTSATQILGKYVTTNDGTAYQNGKWIEISYGRPIKRGRDLWGSGTEYGKRLNDDGPVWRAGANQSTQLTTQVSLVINGKTVPVGTYTMFIELKPNNWTLIVSRWEAQKEFDQNNKTQLFGAFGYTSDKDVVRAPMTLGTLPFSADQLAWQFLDVSDEGGKIAIMWDKVIASVPFRVGS